MSPYEQLIKAASEYIDRGLSVIPLIGKIPPIKWEEYQERRMTLEEFQMMAEIHALTGIGIVTGKISGLAVVDIDSEEAKSKFPTPITPTVRTKKGWHLYFKYPTGGIKNSAGKIMEKVDVRGDGGYVVAPPSAHPDGGTYEWLVGMETELAEFPQEFLKSEPQEERQEGKDWKTILRGLPEGQRNDALARVAGKFLAQTPESDWDGLILPTLRLINGQNTPPLSDAEVEATFRSIAIKEKEGRSDKNVSTSKIQILSVQELLESEESEAKYLIDKLLPSQGINVMSGQPGAGKSWVMLEMARVVASGSQFLGKYSTVQGPVMILDGESGRQTLKGRMRSMGFDKNLPIYIASQQGIKLDNDTTLKHLLIKARELAIKFLIIDPLSAMHSKVENNAEEMQKVMEAMEAFTKNGITVLFLHHHRKEGAYKTSASQNLRGSSVIHSRVDSQSVIVNEGDEGRVIRIRYSQEKLRTGRKEKAFELFLEDDETGIHLKYGGSSEMESSKIEQAIEEIPVEVGSQGKTKLELMAATKKLDISPRTTESAIKILLKAGQITKSKKDGRNFYTLAKDITSATEKTRE